MDIKTATETELKAAAFDLLAQRDAVELQLRAILEELTRRQQEKATAAVRNDV